MPDRRDKLDMARKLLRQGYAVRALKQTLRFQYGTALSSSAIARLREELSDEKSTLERAVVTVPRLGYDTGQPVPPLQSLQTGVDVQSTAYVVTLRLLAMALAFLGGVGVGAWLG